MRLSELIDHLDTCREELRQMGMGSDPEVAVETIAGPFKVVDALIGARATSPQDGDGIDTWYIALRTEVRHG